MIRKLIASLLVASLSFTLTIHASETTDSIARAAQHFEMAEIEQAKELLSKALAAGITAQEALQVRIDLGMDVLLKMMQNDALAGSVERILQLAAKAEKEKLLSPDVLKALVADLEGSFPARQLAMEKLAAAGDVAVPHIFVPLSDQLNDDRRTYAHMALARLDKKAVWPLCAALDAEDPLLRANVALALGNIGDPRAIPYLKQIVETPQEVDTVRSKADESLRRILRDTRRSLPPASQLFLSAAEDFFRQIPRREKSEEPIARAWSWKDGGLVGRELPLSLWTAEMARADSLKALQLAPQSREAARLFICSTFALRLLAEKPPPGSPAEGYAEENRTQWMTYALDIFGLELKAEALQRLMSERWDGTVLLCLETFSNQFDLFRYPYFTPPRRVSAPIQPALRQAMNYPNAEVRATALALQVVTSLAAIPPENASDLIKVAIASLSFSTAPTAMILSPDGEIRNRFSSALREAEFVVAEAATHDEALARASEQLQFEAIVIDEKLISTGVRKALLLEHPSLERAALFIVATGTSAKTTRKNWPQAKAIFSGAEKDEFIKAALLKATAEAAAARSGLEAIITSGAADILTLLAQISPTEDLARFIPQLDTLVREDAGSAEAAIAALAATKNTYALPTLERALRLKLENYSSEVRSKIRTSALMAMAEISIATGGDTQKILPLLLEVIHGPDKDLSRRAMAAIGLLGLAPGQALDTYLDATR